MGRLPEWKDKGIFIVPKEKPVKIVFEDKYEITKVSETEYILKMTWGIDPKLLRRLFNE